MDNKPQYTKLSALVGDTFTVEKAYGFTWKKFDPESKRMLISETYEEGYRKVYSLDTDKGKLDVSGSQLGNLLEGTYKNGEANIIGRTFAVKSNGKTGIDIRYFLNLAKEQPKPVEEVFEDTEEPIDMDSIPF